MLTWATAAEYRQTHPIARAILQTDGKGDLDLPPIDGAHYRVIRTPETTRTMVNECIARIWQKGTWCYSVEQTIGENAEPFDQNINTRQILPYLVMPDW